MKKDGLSESSKNKAKQSQFQRQINAVAKIGPAQSVLYAFSLPRTLLYAIIFMLSFLAEEIINSWKAA